MPGVNWGYNLPSDVWNVLYLRTCQCDLANAVRSCEAPNLLRRSCRSMSRSKPCTDQSQPDISAAALLAMEAQQLASVCKSASVEPAPTHAAEVGRDQSETSSRFMEPKRIRSMVFEIILTFAMSRKRR